MSAQHPENSQDSAGVGAYQRRGGSKRTIVIAAAIAAVVALLAVVSLVVISANTQSKAQGTLTVGLVLPPSNLDVRNTKGAALDQVLLDNVYQGLVTFKPGTLDVTPALAESYKISDDGLTYTFDIKTDAKFHSGEKLSTDDVVSSLEETSALLGESFKTVSALNDSTVEIQLTEPNSQLLYLLAGRAGIILEQGAENDLKNSANGTGPYALEEWKQGDSITLAAVENYWGAPATLETVIFRYITDGKAAVNATLEGDLDVQTAVLPDLQAEFENETDIKLIRAASTDVFTLAYNNAKAPLNDLRVREAISRAIDQDALIQAMIGDGLPLGSPITEIEPGYRDLTDVNAFDPESSRKLLAEAGVKDLSLTLTIPNIYGTTIPNLLVSQLKDVGISLTVNQVEFTTWVDQVIMNKSYELSYVDHVEARDFGNYANPDYYFNYDNAKVQQLYAESLAARDENEASEKLAEASEIVAKDAVAKWLFNYTPTTAIHSKVSGFPTSNTNSRINLEGVTVAE